MLMGRKPITAACIVPLLFSCSRDKSGESEESTRKAGSLRGEVRFDRTGHDLGIIHADIIKPNHLSFLNKPV